MNWQLGLAFNRATKNTCRFQKITLTDSVIVTLYVQKVAELLSKIEEVPGGVKKQG